MILILILGCVYSLAYYLENDDRSSSLFDRMNVNDEEKLVELQKIEWPTMIIEKGGSEIYFFQSDKRKISFLKFEKILRIFKSIEGTREFQPDKITSKLMKDYFDDEDRKILFYFKKGLFTVQLGRKVTFSDTFYLKLSLGEKTMVILAKDISSLKGVYRRGERYLNSEKYRRLKKIFNLSRKDLLP